MLDFSAYIAERTQSFTGREWVFQRIDHWLRGTGNPRVFLLTGASGVGKTALAARLVEMSQGIVSADKYPRSRPPGSDQRVGAQPGRQALHLGIG